MQGPSSWWAFWLFLIFQHPNKLASFPVSQHMARQLPSQDFCRFQGCLCFPGHILSLFSSWIHSGLLYSHLSPHAHPCNSSFYILPTPTISLRFVGEGEGSQHSSPISTLRLPASPVGVTYKFYCSSTLGEATMSSHEGHCGSLLAGPLLPRLPS